MEMNERKLQILQAIILNYLETAEPVGSRTISRRFLMDLSSATIRNECQTWRRWDSLSSLTPRRAGIPSAKGYRLYVDQLMKRDQVTPEDRSILVGYLKDKTLQLDSLLREIGDLLATLTKYTAVVTMPQLRRSKIETRAAGAAG